MDTRDLSFLAIAVGGGLITYAIWCRDLKVNKPRGQAILRSATAIFCYVTLAFWITSESLWFAVAIGAMLATASSIRLGGLLFLAD